MYMVWEIAPMLIKADSLLHLKLAVAQKNTKESSSSQEIQIFIRSIIVTKTHEDTPNNDSIKHPLLAVLKINAFPH